MALKIQTGLTRSRYTEMYLTYINVQVPNISKNSVFPAAQSSVLGTQNATVSHPTGYGPTIISGPALIPNGMRKAASPTFPEFRQADA